MSIYAYEDKATEDIDKAAIYRLHAAFCKNLADANRLLIIDILGDGELPVGEIAQKLVLPQSNVSKHLALMRERGLVVTRREGANIYYRLSDARISEAIRLLKKIHIEQIEKQSTLARKSV
ncbi:MAG: metalloregulator ArsR/SmtB family transcription factor [Dehalococcoidales bacterium]|nr:metalloregulator ArsR/SmtB family transcription factor [Dehalococcoidales bacterium]